MAREPAPADIDSERKAIGNMRDRVAVAVLWKYSLAGEEASGRQLSA